MIPPRKNARPWKFMLKGSAGTQQGVRACHRLGRSIWQKWIGYHRRSLVETKMPCFGLTPVSRTVKCFGIETV